MKAKQDSEIDIDKPTYDRQFALGTLFHGIDGDVWKYGEVSFGSCQDGEMCFYQWFPWNGSARLKDTFQDTGLE